MKFIVRKCRLLRKIVERLYLSFSDNLVYYDQLTKLCNRNYYELVAKNRWNNKKCKVVMMDIDNFKSINDNYSHESGNRALKAAAGVLMTIPYVDEVIRYGGDEFILISDDEEFSMDYMEWFYHVMSYGMIDKSESEDLDSAISRADDAMYEMKKIKKVGR